MIYKNNRAIVGYPLYLSVAIIAAAVIIAFLYQGINTMINDSQVHLVEQEIDKIMVEAKNMFEYADSGTLISVSVDIPVSVKYIVFGSLPKSDLKIPSDLCLDENTSNNAYYVMDDESYRIYHCNARFSGDNIDEIAVLYPGVYNLKLELVKNSGMSYVKITS